MWANWFAGRSPLFSGRRQPPCDGTSRMMREYPVRICEGLGVKFLGPTRHYIFHITARPRLLSVTESIVLPPRPRGGQYVKYQQIQSSRVARSSGTAADLF